MARPRKTEFPESLKEVPEIPQGFADTLRRVDTGDQIEQAAKHLLRKAAEGDDWAISLVADLLRSDQ